MAGAEPTVHSGCGDCFHMMPPREADDNMDDDKNEIDHQSPKLCWHLASVILEAILDSMPVNGSPTVTYRKFPCSPVSASSSIQRRSRHHASRQKRFVDVESRL